MHIKNFMLISAVFYKKQQKSIKNQENASDFMTLLNLIVGVND